MAARPFSKIMEIALKNPVYGVMSEYDTPEAMMDAAYAARAAGYKKIDGFSPFPVEGLTEALGETDHRVPYFTLAGACTGFATAYGLQYITGVITYPINIGGRPLLAQPAFVLITFELMVLFAVSACILTMLILNRLPKLHHPVFDLPRFRLATLDRFFLVVEADDACFDRRRSPALLRRLGAVRIEPMPSGDPDAEAAR